MKNLTKSLTFLLATTFLSSSFCFVPITELIDKKVTAETLSSTATAVKPTSKIVYENVNVSDPDNVASVVSALNSTREETTTSVTLQLADSFTEEFIPPTKSDLTVEEAQTILREWRAKVKAHYDNANAKTAKSLNLDDMSDDYYISSYAPFISIELGESITSKDVQNINALAENKAISTIFVTQKTIHQEEQQEVLSIDNSIDLEEQAAEFMQRTNPATRVIDYDATGIVVGLLDEALVDVNHSNMKKNSDPVSTEMINCQTYLESGNPNTNKQHATAVATVLTGQYGVAKNLSLLSAEAKGSSIYQEIDWMLQNDVNIINISWEHYNSNFDEYCGEYSSEALYLDYIARTSYVTIVKAVGNMPDENTPINRVGRMHGWEFGPPVGYNMIVVGSSNNDNDLSDFSCYVEATDCVMQPEDSTSSFEHYHTNMYDPELEISLPLLEVPHVIAFGEYSYMPGLTQYKGPKTYFGTSFSAPFVAGGIALIMKQNTNLICNPAANIAMIMATSEFLQSYYGSNMGMGIHEQVGAGNVNIIRLLQTSAANFTFTTYRDDLYYNVACEKTFYAEKNQIVQIACCNFANIQTDINFNENSLSSGYEINNIVRAVKMTDYGLYLCDSNGNTLYYCDTQYNTEYLRVVIPRTGNYTIKVRQESDSGENGPITRADSIGLAYYLIG